VKGDKYMYGNDISLLLWKRYYN